jgi:hypothetical protein
VGIPPERLLAGERNPTSNLAAPSPAKQIITLIDGSVIKGQLIDVQENYYFIQSDTLGMIRIHVNDLASISIKPTASNVVTPLSSPSNPLSSWLNESSLSSLMANPEIMTTIQTMLQDPQIAQLLQKEDVLTSVLSLDPQQIQNNPELKPLLNHPKMQELIEKLGSIMFQNPNLPELPSPP